LDPRKAKELHQVAATVKNTTTDPIPRPWRKKSFGAPSKVAPHPALHRPGPSLAVSSTAAPTSTPGRWPAGALRQYGHSMSDLQCAARIIVVTPLGLNDVQWLASTLCREHVQAVYAADDVPSTGPVETLAGDLGVPCHSGDGGLHHGSDGLRDIVDRHRGETVVVVRTGSATEPILMLVDADGTSIHSLDESD
jgi:hypothetical protein